MEFQNLEFGRRPPLDVIGLLLFIRAVAASDLRAPILERLVMSQPIGAEEKGDRVTTVHLSGRIHLSEAQRADTYTMKAGEDFFSCGSARRA